VVTGKGNSPTATHAGYTWPGGVACPPCPGGYKYGGLLLQVWGIVRELKIAMSRRRKKLVVSAGSRSTTPESGAGAPNDHRDSSRASVKPIS